MLYALVQKPYLDSVDEYLTADRSGNSTTPAAALAGPPYVCTLPTPGVVFVQTGMVIATMAIIAAMPFLVEQSVLGRGEGGNGSSSSAGSGAGDSATMSNGLESGNASSSDGVHGTDRTLVVHSSPQRSVPSIGRATSTPNQTAARLSPTRLIDVLSHEIRQPLTTIMLNCNMLVETGLTVGQANYLTGIERSCSILLAVVNDVLDATRILTGTVSLANEKVNLKDVVQVVVCTVAPAAAEKSVELVFYADPYSSYWAIADAARLRQILHNLLDNAVKFTPEGGTIFCEVQRVADSIPTRWRIVVEDSGIGMNDEQISALFNNASVSSDESSSSRTKKLEPRLGLYIVNNLVSLMGGSVHVASELDSGTKFTLEFPFDPCLPDSWMGEEEMGLPANTKQAALQRHARDASQELIHPTHIASQIRVLVISPCVLLRDVLLSYAKYFFREVVSQCTFECLLSVRSVRLTINRALEQKEGPPPLFVAIVDCGAHNEALERCLRRLPSGLLTEMMVASSTEIRKLRQVSEYASRVNVVYKPALLASFCSTLARGLVAATNNAQRSVGDANSSASDDSTEVMFSTARDLNVENGLVGVDDLQVGPSSSPGDSETSQLTRSMTVLVVDDIPMIRSLVQHVIESVGHTVITAADGEEALNLMQQNHPSTGVDSPIDVVLLDLEMPIMTGTDSLRLLREWEAQLDEPYHLTVVAMTANALREERLRCLQAGFDDFIAKPVSRKVLRDLLSKYESREPLIAAPRASVRENSTAAPLPSSSPHKSGQPKVRKMSADIIATLEAASDINAPSSESSAPKRRKPKRRGKNRD
jgi:signal transduction histidine kinase/CheY-like chemotaxis protein